MRAIPGQATTPMANEIVHIEGSNRATSTIANSSAGSTWKNSVKRMRALSSQPP